MPPHPEVESACRYARACGRPRRAGERRRWKIVSASTRGGTSARPEAGPSPDAGPPPGPSGRRRSLLESAAGLAALSFLVLVVATAARPGAGGAARLDRPLASALLSVLLTLVGLAGLASLALALALVVGRSRRRGPEPAAGRPSSLRRLFAPLVLVAWMAAAALLIRAFARRHSPTALGSAAAAGRTLRAAPHALPFDPVAAGATLAAVALTATLVLALGVVTRPRGRRARLVGLPALGADGSLADPADAAKRLAAALEAVEVPDPDTEPDPRRAVVAAWLSLEEAARAAGVARSASETAEELLAALQRRLGATAAAARRLTAAFEVARYSDHPVGEALRGECIAALAAVRTELAAAS